MNLFPPFSISSRLMPALQIAGASIQIERCPEQTDDNRDRFAWVIDLPAPYGGEYSGTDLCSGCGGGTLQDTFVSLLSFLSAAADSYAYSERMGCDGFDGENANLFPRPVVAWAADNVDELAMAWLELEEAAPGSLIVE